MAAMTRWSPSSRLETVYDDVSQYYTRKITKYGPTPLGVDWSCVPTQEMRFVQLLKICKFEHPFSLNDLGCGYGAILTYLSRRHRSTLIDYMGVDLSVAMIDHANRLWQRRPGIQFSVSNSLPRIADYSVASGIFNVKLQQPLELWQEFIKMVLADMYTNSKLGFAVNFLAPLPPGSPEIPELYRVEPENWRIYCEENFKVKATILSNYGMKEFTLLVKPL